MMEQTTTKRLESVLKEAGREQIGDFLKQNAQKLADGEKPFAAYMRQKLREKKLSQQRLFLEADLPEGYGYKLISEEKHTRQRDVILRLCIAAGFSLDETTRALELYKMPGLYARLPRDAALIVAINTGVHDVCEVDALLTRNGQQPLYACSPEE